MASVRNTSALLVNLFSGRKQWERAYDTILYFHAKAIELESAHVPKPPDFCNEALVECFGMLAGVHIANVSASHIYLTPCYAFTMKQLFAKLLTHFFVFSQPGSSYTLEVADGAHATLIKLQRLMLMTGASGVFINPEGQTWVFTHTPWLHTARHKGTVFKAVLCQIYCQYKHPNLSPEVKEDMEQLFQQLSDGASYESLDKAFPDIKKWMAENPWCETPLVVIPTLVNADR